MKSEPISQEESEEKQQGKVIDNDLNSSFGGLAGKKRKNISEDQCNVNNTSTEFIAYLQQV